MKSTRKERQIDRRRTGNELGWKTRYRNAGQREEGEMKRDTRLTDCLHHDSVRAMTRVRADKEASGRVRGGRKETKRRESAVTAGPMPPPPLPPSLFHAQFPPPPASPLGFKRRRREIRTNRAREGGRRGGAHSHSADDAAAAAGHTRAAFLAYSSQPQRGKSANTERAS